VHVVPQDDGSCIRQLRGPGDVSHVGWPAVAGDMPESIQGLEAALHSLEEYRDPCLRGERAPSPAIVAACDEALAQALAVYRSLLPGDARP